MATLRDTYPPQIPVDPNIKAPPAVAPDWRRDSELGRQVNNTVNALGGMGPALMAPVGLRAMNLQRVAEGSETASIAANKVGPAVAAAVGANGVAQAADKPELPAFLRDRGSAPMGVMRPIEPGTNPGARLTAPVTPTDVPAGWMSRDLAGAAGVRRMTTPDGRTLYTNVTGPDNERLMGSKPGLQVAPGALAPTGAPASSAPALVPQTETVGVRGNVSNDLRAKMDATDGSRLDDWWVGLHGTRAERMQRKQLAHDTDMQEAGRGVTLRGQDMSLEGQRASTAATLRGQDITAEGQRISADTTRRGQDMTSQSARAQARMQQMQADRTYNLEVARFGHEQAKTNFDQRERADKDLTTKLEAMYPGADGKPDANMVAQHKQAVNAYLSAAIAKAEAVPPGAPEYERAQQLADKLRANGVAALGEDKLRAIRLGLEAKRANADNSSWLNPFKGTRVDSDNPADYAIVGEDHNWLTPNQYIHANGARTPVGVLNNTEGSPVFNIANARTSRFDELKNQDKKGARE
jgi:hypothetical protein